MTTPDYGTDLAVTEDGDIDVTGALISGPRVLAEDLRRRFTSRRGSVVYSKNAGVDVRDFLNEGFTARSRLEAEVTLASEARKDARISRAKCTAAFNQATQSMRVAVAADTTSGPFERVLEVSAVSVSILERSRPE
jgi:hypothetical protein